MLINSKYIYVLLTLFWVGINSRAQNLIPNSSFEIYSSCPTSAYGEINKLKNWYDMTISADYYNCGAQMPNNNFGFQYPNSGNGYIGFAHNERPAVRLIQTLEQGRMYEVEMFVSPANSSNIVSEIAILLSEDSLCGFTTIYDSHVYSNDTPLSDTAVWTNITFTFIASGCEKFLALDIPNGAQAYYYFDDIFLQCIDPLGCVPPLCIQTYSEIIPNIFSPNGSGLNDNFKIEILNSEITDFNCTIYNRWGNKIRNIEFPLLFWNGKDDNGDEVPEGVYYYFLNFTITQCGEWHSRNGYVHLHR